MIKPTIGRKVWFFPAAGEPEEDATVIDVHGDRLVSLYVINRGGTPSNRRSVTLVQEGDETPAGAYCTWMPYQVGQAKASAPAVVESATADAAAVLEHPSSTLAGSTPEAS